MHFLRLVKTWKYEESVLQQIYATKIFASFWISTAQMTVLTTIPRARSISNRKTVVQQFSFKNETLSLISRETGG